MTSCAATDVVGDESWRSAGVMLPYQRRWIADKSSMKVCEKSRRIGLTWASAADSVLEASDGSIDTWYIGYSEDAAHEFIRDCKGWCHHFGFVAGKDVEQVFVSTDEDRVSRIAVDERDILAFRITFRSGKRITALSSRPRNLRGKQGKVIIDEAAFHDDLAELIKAAVALLMWGGRVEIISTHNGEDNPFNLLIKDIRSGKYKYSLHRITLDDALEQGLYRRICFIRRLVYSEEAERQWRQELIDHYGAGASEELFCNPTALTTGMVFNRNWFPTVPANELPAKLFSIVRFWDLAATEKKRENDPDFTAGCKLAKLPNDLGVVVLDMIMVMENPAAVEELMKTTAKLDGRRVGVGYEEEGGSSGKIVTNHLKTEVFRGYRFFPRRSTGDKVTRARPVSAQAKKGRVWLREAPWNEDFLTYLHQFPFGRYDDPVDALSGAYNLIVGEGSALERYKQAIVKM